MASTSTEVAKKYIRSIQRSLKSLRDRLERDVNEVCSKVLPPLRKLIENKMKERKDEFPNSDVPAKLTPVIKHFSDIYWSLKLHLAFHLGEDTARQNAELKKLGEFIVELAMEDLDKLPGLEYAIDPVSKILEIVSYLMESSSCKRGSHEHAGAVMNFAKKLLSKLRRKNTFRPMVLAVVSRADGSHVGSSLKVSKFLRPLYLHKRISHFKSTLKKAIIFDKVLNVNSQNWSSSACNGQDYTVNKRPCQNCREMFGNLEGFVSDVPNNNNLEEASGKTILGHCAEYCPVNELLPDEPLSEAVTQAIDEALTRHYDRCTILFINFREIALNCNEAVRSSVFTDDLYQDARQKFEIFGFSSEWNNYF